VADARPVVVELAGELDLATAPDLRDRLLAALEAARWHPSHTVTIDLAGVMFMDATSLGMIATAAARCEHAGGELRVRNANRIQHKMFRLFGLDALLEAEPKPPNVPHQHEPS
jgi:anti-sigma B factor antagonist